MVDVMYATDQLVEALQTIDGLQVHTRPNQNLTPPAAAVSFPTVRFDETYARGLDRLEYEITVYVGERNERTAIRRVTPFIEAVKDAVEEWAEFQTAMVTDAQVDVLDAGEVQYLAVVFNVWIVAGDELQEP